MSMMETKWAEIQRLRKEAMIDEVYESADGEREIARIGDKWGFVGENLDSFIYDRLEYTQNAYEFLCQKDGKWGVIIHQPHNELSAEYDEIIYRDGWYLIRKGDKWGLQIWGNHIPPVYDELDIPEEEGYVMVRLGDKWGYIDGNLQFTTELSGSVGDVLTKYEPF